MYNIFCQKWTLDNKMSGESKCLVKDCYKNMSHEKDESKRFSKK